jgi:acetylglutamate kinase
MSYRSFVLKCGGSTLAALPNSFYEDVTVLQQQGILAVVVHGGGPAITDMLNLMNIESRFVDGLRVTNEATLDVVEMVLSGQMNKEIVRKIQATGSRAIGISGVDGHLIEARPVANADQIGYVGEVTHIHKELIHALLQMNYIPVIAPLGISANNAQRYNINADTAAGAIASSIDAEQLVIVTDVPGIMKSIDGEKHVLSHITVQEVEAMIANGEIYGGMIPKVRAAMLCIQGNLQEVIIVDGKHPQILRKIFQNEQIGTRIRKS